MILEQYKKQITSGVLDSQNYSLCHGNFAFVDFLISYMKIFGYDQKISDYISKIKNKGVMKNAKNGRIQVLFINQ
jgi:lantibiotic modifying enzyme